MKKLPCTIDGIDYESEVAAAKASGISRDGLKYRLISSNFPGYISKYHKKKKRGEFVSCIIKGIKYRSIKSAAKAFGISPYKMRCRLDSFDFPNYVYEKIPKKPLVSYRKRGFLCSIDGVHYENMAAASKALGISCFKVKSRLGSFDYPNYVSEKIAKKASSPSRSQPCIIKGVEYVSIMSAAKELGIPYNEMRYRVASFDFPDYVCEKRPKKPSSPYKKKRNQPCIIDGVEYKTVMSASRALGIRENRLRHRLSSPNFPNYVSEQYPKKNHWLFASCTIKGVGYRSINFAAKTLGISYYEMRYRLSSLDFPDYVCEKITKKASVPYRKRGFPCTINGIDYESVKFAAKTLGISYYEMRYRLSSLDFPDYVCEKITKKASVPYRKRGFPCTINGIDYESVKFAAEAFGISYYEMRNRLSSLDFPDYVCEKITKKASSPSRSHPCIIKGVEYVSMMSAARSLGITVAGLQSRLRSFNYPEYISKHHSKIQRRKIRYPCTIKGVHYESELAAAKATGMSGIGLRVRFRSSNYPEYISKYHSKIQRRKVRFPCTIKGVEYVSFTSAAKKLKISLYTISNRLKSFDYPDYVCADIPKVEKPIKPIKYKFAVNGKKYATLREIGDMEGLTRERIRQKMNDPKKPEYQRL